MLIRAYIGSDILEGIIALLNCKCFSDFVLLYIGTCIPDWFFLSYLYFKIALYCFIVYEGPVGVGEVEGKLKITYFFIHTIWLSLLHLSDPRKIELLEILGQVEVLGADV